MLRQITSTEEEPRPDLYLPETPDIKGLNKGRYMWITLELAQRLNNCHSVFFREIHVSHRTEHMLQTVPDYGDCIDQARLQLCFSRLLRHGFLLKLPRCTSSCGLRQNVFEEFHKIHRVSEQLRHLNIKVPCWFKISLVTFS
jgi:hypothetical protein